MGKRKNSCQMKASHVNSREKSQPHTGLGAQKEAWRPGPFPGGSGVISISVTTVGIPWWSSGWDSRLPSQGAQVHSLVREPRSHIQAAWYGQKTKQNNKIAISFFS